MSEEKFSSSVDAKELQGALKRLHDCSDEKLYSKEVSPVAPAESKDTIEALGRSCFP